MDALNSFSSFLSPQVPVPILSWLYWACQFQLVSSLFSCSIDFSNSLARSRNFSLFAFFLFYLVVILKSTIIIRVIIIVCSRITGSLALWVECSLVVRETGVQSQVTSYQRLRKWYLIPPSITLSNIRHVSRVKWSNPEKGVASSPTPWCSSYWKGSLLVALDYGRQLYFTFSYSRSSI